jgi:DNA-directed RNA polymerase subunit RPC12/RpoP
MEKIEVLCPRCGSQVALMEYGRYPSREFKKFEHSYEDWCPFCGERIVEHVALSGSLEHKVNEKSIIGC